MELSLQPLRVLFLFLYFNFKNVFCMYVWYAFGYVFARVCGMYANAHLLVFGGQRCLVSFWIVFHLIC